MDAVWAVILIVLSLLAWGGQVIYAISPRLGAKLGVGEAKSDVHPVFFIDARGEAIWDSMILWSLLVAGILLLFSHPLWPYFGLVGGSCYLYFAGRNLITRRMLQRHDISIGSLKSIKIAYVFVSIWGIVGLVTIFMAASTLKT